MKSRNTTNSYSKNGANITAVYQKNTYEHINIDEIIKESMPLECDGYFLHYRIEKCKDDAPFIVITNMTLDGSKDYISLKIPDEINGIPVVEIDIGAFKRCNELISVELGKNVKTIQPEAFFACTNLKDIKFSEGLTIIGAYAFSRTNASNVSKFSDSLKKIHQNAFSRSGIKSVILGNSVELIDFNAFSQCDKLKSFTIPDSITTISPSFLSDCKSLTSVHIGKNTLIDCALISGCKKLSEFTVHPENKHYKVLDGVLYNNDGSILLVYPRNKQGELFKIPKNVRHIRNGAFPLDVPLETVYIKQDSISNLAISGLLSGKITIHCRKDTDVYNVCQRCKAPVIIQESKLESFLDDIIPDELNKEKVGC